MSAEELNRRFDEGIELHRRGELVAASEHYEYILLVDPEQYSVHYLLGTLHLQNQQVDAAVKHLNLAFEHGERTADLCNNLGIGLLAQKKLLEAAECFKLALQLSPEYLQARYNLARILLQQRELKPATEQYEIILQAEPGNQEVLGILGECAIAQQNYRLALSYLTKLQAPVGEILFKLAYCQAKLELNRDASVSYQKYLHSSPQHLEAWVNLSYVAERAGLLPLAISAAKKVLEIDGKMSQAWNNLGVAYRSSHLLDEAIMAFEQGLKHAPTMSLLKYNLATTFMLSGDYPAGWPGYEERTALVPPVKLKLSSSRWNGTSAPGKRLLITVDQGLGDTIQFARFLPMIIEESRMEVAIACQETLVELLEYSFPEVRCTDEFQPLPEHDLHFPLTSVGKLWGLTLGDVGYELPYLQVPSTVQERIRSELQTYELARFKHVGLVWRGNPLQARDIVRSMSLNELSPLFDLEGIAWFSLNIDAVSKQELSELQDCPVQDLSSHIHSMTDTAAILKELDLLITVDTSIAHLAGALGVTCWTMLCHTPDWRWHLNREDSPWYPSMKLYRQESFGSWESVIQQVKVELAGL